MPNGFFIRATALSSRPLPWHVARFNHRRVKFVLANAGKAGKTVAKCKVRYEQRAMTLAASSLDREIAHRA